MMSQESKKVTTLLGSLMLLWCSFKFQIHAHKNLKNKYFKKSL